MSTRIRVLILEDRAADADLMLHELRQAGFDPDWQRVDIEPDYLKGLEANPDLILADWSLPQFSGLRALRLVNKRGLDIPFIIVSGSVGEEAAVEFMRQGASDYVLKDRLTRLGQAVRHALEDKQLREERKQAEEALRKKDEHYRNVIESIFRFVPEGLLVLNEDFSPLKQNKAFGELVQQYAAQLGYTEQELAELITEQVRRKILSEDTTEIQIPKKRL